MTLSERTRAAIPIADGHVVVGVIIGAWGLRGDLKIETHSDYPDRFVPEGVVYLDGEPCVILRTRYHKAGRVIGLDTIFDRTSADRLCGRALTVPASEMPELDVNTFFYFDIIEMAVRTTHGDELGRIEEILTTGASDVYVVRGSGREVLIPAVREYVVDVDVERGVMTVSLPKDYLNEMCESQTVF